MKSLISKQVERFLREQKNYKRWLAVFLCLAVVVTLGTTAALKYKGIAVTGDADAAQEMHMEQTGETQTVVSEEVPEGMRRHVHTDACYEERKVLVCKEGKAEAGDAGASDTEEADTGSTAPETSEPDTSQGHHHSDSCYEVTGGELVCGKEEHTHDDSCYTGGGETLTCGKEEGEGATDGHQHSDSCYGENENGERELTCGKDEGEGAEDGHHHDDSCYGGGERELTCGKEEHKHNESCYDGGEKKLICGMEEGAGAAETQAAPAAEAPATEAAPAAETPAADAAPAAEASAVEGEHVHTDACYELQKVLVCGKEEGELEEIPVEEEYKAGKLTCKGEDYEIIVSYGAEAKIPEGAKLKVEEIEKDSETYEKCYNQMVEALAAESDGEEPEVSFIRFFDITILADGKEIEPEKEVTVQINYNDAVVDDDAEQEGFAVHFPSSGGTEILDAEVKDKKGFEFSQGSFSIAGGGMAKVPAKAGRLEWSGDGCKIIVSWDKKVTVPADAKLNVEEIKKSNESYRKYLDNSKGAIKAKKNGKSEESGADESEFARFFKISVEDGSGKKISTNGVVEIRVEYDNAITAGTAGTAAMVLAADDNSEVLGDLTDMEEGEEISKFQANRKLDGKDFNVGTMVLAEGEDGVIEGGGTGTKGTHNNISGYLDLDTINNAANMWQVGNELYKGNSSANKPVQNDNVRIQKNVIPTDVENEFLVYLSIDVKTTVSEQFDISMLGILRNSNDSIGANVQIANTADYTITEKPQQGMKVAENITFIDYYTNKPIPGLENICLNWKEANNVRFFYKIPGSENRCIILSDDISPGPYPNGLKIKIPKEVSDAIKTQHKETSILKTVVDEMGPYITCEEIIGGDYFTKSISENKKTLTWEPAVDPDCKTDPEKAEDIKNGEFWNLNAAQLLYRVKLDVTAEGFQSCAEHINSNSADKECNHFTPVNSDAYLTYGEDNTKVHFSQPTVRGLRYNVALKKIDKDNKALLLPGAEFEIRGTDDGTYDVTGITQTLTTGTEGTSKGILKFTDLPCGTYELYETVAPEGYKAITEAGGKKVGEVRVCYTDEPHGEKLIVDVPNMLYRNEVATDGVLTTDENGYIPVENEKIPPIKLVKVWEDNNDTKKLRPDSVIFKVEYKTDTGWSTVSDNNVTIEYTKNWEEVIEVPEADGYRVTEILPVDSGDNYKIKADDSTEYADEGKTIPLASLSSEKYEGKDIGVYTITNELASRQIEFVKVDQEDNGLPGAKFVLYRRPDNTEFDPDAAAVVGGWPEGGVEKGERTSGEDGEFFTGELQVGDYWLKEIEAPEGYLPIEAPYELSIRGNTVTLAKGGSTPTDAEVTVDESTNKITIKIKNTLAEQPVKILKKATGTDPGTGYLKGAEFDVYYSEVGNRDEARKIGTWKSVADVEGLDDGILVDEDNAAVTTLNVGTYYLAETKAPEGYILAEKEFVIVVTKGGISVGYGMGSMSMEKDSEGLYVVEITNSTGAILPEAGGPGTSAYTFGGLAMIIAVSLMYGLNMRRKRGKGGMV